LAFRKAQPLPGLEREAQILADDMLAAARMERVCGLDFQCQVGVDDERLVLGPAIGDKVMVEGVLRVANKASDSEPLVQMLQPEGEGVDEKFGRAGKFQTQDSVASAEFHLGHD